MNTFQEKVSECLTALHGPDAENAYHSLIECGGEVVPLLTTRFHNEADPATRATLVSIAWQAGLSEALLLLRQALDDPESVVWKGAIDGLVAIGSQNAVNALQDARVHADAPKAGWLDEAIEQIGDAISGEQ